MAMIYAGTYTNTGTFDTRDLPDHYDPVFCGKCGDRIGWADTHIMDASDFRGICDDCAADVANNGEEED